MRRWGLICLFLLAVLPRALYPVSRPLQWYFRSSQFFSHILSADWAGTLLSEHPGVTVMWLSGAALWAWHGLRTLLGLPSPSPLETAGTAFADRVAVGVLPLALLVALGIVWGWHLLRRLFGERVAWAAGILWAVDPFFLANSKVLHLDATLSTLMLLSALHILVHLQDRELRPLVISGLLAGLAILTKITALFLAPFLGLCLLVEWFSSFQPDESRWRSLAVAAGRLLLWFLIAGVTCVLLWPSLWVQPGKSIDLAVRQGIILHAGGPRDQPLFYRGTLAVQDPGPRFYIDVLLYRSTFLTLPFAVAGFLMIGATNRRKNAGQGRRASWLLAAFAGFYFVQMSLGDWKDSRYMLPVLLVMDICAAHGVTSVAERLFTGRWRRAALVAVLIGTQALMVLLRHPYYGSHYNHLLGGAQRASRVFPLAEFGEGLDQAGRYVDGQLDPDKGCVGTQFLANEMVAQHVRAPVYDINEVGQESDYLVFGVQYTTRGASYPRWGELWETIYKFREPTFVAKIGGIPYAWVHRPHADPLVPQRVDAQLGDAIRLRGYRLNPTDASPGDTLLLTLYWEAEAPVDGTYKVFSHLCDEEGGLRAQQDNLPLRGAHPTQDWIPGTLIEDPYELQIPSDAATGQYALHAGMYDPQTLERLPALDGEGNPAPDDSLHLATVRVRPRVPRWRWALSAAWLAAIAAGLIYTSVAPSAGSSEA